jgi:hypothetical protein
MTINPNRESLLSNSEHTTDKSENLNKLQQNKLFRQDIHLIITESLARKQTPFFNLILKLIDYVKEKMGYTTTLSKQLEQKISTHLPKNLSNNSALIESIRKQIIESPQNFTRTLPQDQIHVFRYDLNDVKDVKVKYSLESIPKSKEQDSELDFVLSRIFKKSSLASIILKGNLQNLNKFIAKNLPANMNQDQNLINRITSYITQNQASLVDDVINAQLDKLLSKSHFRNELLKIMSDNFTEEGIENLLIQSVDRNLLSKKNIIENFCSYIMQNKESISDFIENIDQRYSENKLDFHANNLLKYSKFRNFFLEILSKNTQNISSQLIDNIKKALMDKENDTELFSKLANYMIENNVSLKIKAQEFEFLQSIENLDFKDKKKVKAILENKENVEENKDDWEQKIIRIFKLQPDLIEPFKTYLAENREEMVLFLQVLTKTRSR